MTDIEQKNRGSDEEMEDGEIPSRTYPKCDKCELHHDGDCDLTRAATKGNWYRKQEQMIQAGNGERTLEELKALRTEGRKNKRHLRKEKKRLEAEAKRVDLGSSTGGETGTGSADPGASDKATTAQKSQVKGKVAKMTPDQRSQARNLAEGMGVRRDKAMTKTQMSNYLMGLNMITGSGSDDVKSTLPHR